MVDKLPFQITPGTANDDSVVHASDADVSDLSRSHTERDISRLQSSMPEYSASKTYAVGDMQSEQKIMWRCVIAITVPEAFDQGKWVRVGDNIPPFLDNSRWNPGDLSLESDIAFRAIGFPNFGTFDASEWTQVGNSAFAYLSTGVYVVGNLVEESGNIYRCITAVTVPETFDPAKWILFVQNPLVNDLDADGNSILNVGRLTGSKGSDVASATTITLGDSNFFDITGTTQIDAMTSTGWSPGSVVVLHFDAALTVTHNTGADGFFLEGATNFISTADDTLTVIWNGSRWEEISRSIN